MRHHHMSSNWNTSRYESQFQIKKKEHSMKTKFKNIILVNKCLKTLKEWLMQDGANCFSTFLNPNLFASIIIIWIVLEDHQNSF